MKPIALIAAVFCSAALGLAGCVAPGDDGAGRSGIGPGAGDPDGTLPHSMAEVEAAVRSVFSREGITQQRSHTNAQGRVRINAEGDDGISITVTLKPRGEALTQVEVRVGLADDHPRNAALERAIRRELGVTD